MIVYTRIGDVSTGLTKYRSLHFHLIIIRRYRQRLQTRSLNQSIRVRTLTL
jgi:hypothetical protein